MPPMVEKLGNFVPSGEEFYSGYEGIMFFYAPLV